MNIKNNPVQIAAPLSAELVNGLHAGTSVSISGIIYTARDAACKRLCGLLDAGKPLPLDLRGQILYFTGPTPAPPGRPIGSAGPTTSYRMDAYSTRLILECGLMGIMGKGEISSPVISAMAKGPCVYLAATGGAGALLAKRIISCETVCYEDLGPEAIRKLMVKDFPAIAAIDSSGGNLFKLRIPMCI